MLPPAGPVPSSPQLEQSWAEVEGEEGRGDGSVPLFLPRSPSFSTFGLTPSCRHLSHLPAILLAWITDARVTFVSVQLTRLGESFLKAFLSLIRWYWRVLPCRKYHGLWTGPYATIKRCAVVVLAACQGSQTSAWNGDPCVQFWCIF